MAGIFTKRSLATQLKREIKKKTGGAMTHPAPPP